MSNRQPIWEPNVNILLFLYAGVNSVKVQLRKRQIERRRMIIVCTVLMRRETNYSCRVGIGETIPTCQVRMTECGILLFFFGFCLLSFSIQHTGLWELITLAGIF